jgi:hypothetical protein
MPKLLLFAPCQKAIISRDDNNVSLIAVLSRVTAIFPAASPTELPKGSVLPMPWSAISVWYRQKEDEGKKYEQQFRLVFGEEDLLETLTTSFSFEGDKTEHRIFTQSMVFPIWKTGICSLKLLWREVGQPEWKEEASYPLMVDHTFTDNQQEAVTHPV